MIPLELAQSQVLDQVGDILDIAIRALAALGLFLYATVRLGLDAFYGRFEVTPEEVGLSQGTILGRAAIYLLVLMSMALAALALTASPALFLYLLGSIDRDSAMAIFVVLAEVLLLAAWVRWIRKRNSDIREGRITRYAKSIRYWSKASTAAIFIGLQVGIIGLAALAEKGGSLGLGLATAMILFGIGAATYTQGRKMATDVALGKELSGRILNLRSHEVEVTWCDEQSKPGNITSSPYVFLGEGDEWLVLCDKKSRRVLRIPAGKALLNSVRLEGLDSDLHEATLGRARIALSKAKAEHKKAETEATSAALASATAELEALESSPASPPPN
jgi:hypothetical protein